MNLTASILMGFYLAVAVVVLLTTVYRDTLENPYARIWEHQGWVWAAVAGLLWPAFAVYMVSAAFTSGRK